MASETYTRSALPPPLWPPDDTEESVVGTDLHQMTIMNVRWGINDIAATHAGPGQPAPWQALSQTIVSGFERPDGSRFKALPDVFVYRHSIDQNRGSLAISVDGPPLLVIEVLSESTYESDLDLDAGKGYSYARAGIREYLALDPTGSYVAERARGWRLVDGRYQTWQQGAGGRWHSEEIAVAIGFEGVFASVYTPDGRRQLREGEAGRRLAAYEEMERELSELRRVVEQLRDHL